MYYVAKVTTGIDLKKVNCKVRGKTITVYTPRTKITDFHFRTKNTKFFESKNSLLRRIDPEHTTEAYNQAEKKVLSKVNKKKLLKTSDDHLVIVLKNILTFAEKEGYTVDVKFK